MRVFFNSGEIIEGHTAPVMRAIKYRKKHDPYLKYKFSRPFTQLEECVYELRTNDPWMMLSFFYRYPYSVIDVAEAIIKGGGNDAK